MEVLGAGLRFRISQESAPIVAWSAWTRIVSANLSSIDVGGAGKPNRRRDLLLPWLGVIAGLCILYVPSLYGLFKGIWSSDEQAHGPIVLLIACWLMYRKWPLMMQASEGERPSAWGWPLFAFGLLLYVIGRSQDILIFEIGSAIWLLTAFALLVRGPSAFKAQWFALFFMLFMIPLPSPVVDAVTMPMKMAVSYVAESVLFAVGYPIARTGVILQVGQYKLLVADACAGLHTLFTLEALGLLYLNLVQRDSLFRNVALAVLIVPISFTANVIRVMVLTLITYHFGDAAGQGFLHGFAGMVLFLSALLLIIATDAVLQFGLKARQRPGEGHA
ncbi:MAG: exosortase B [Burkholderiales bacterium]|nr:exosortase B [Burkholderiales bacterium]